MKYDYVLALDFDGVLADSIAVLFESFREFLQSFDLSATKELFDYYDGTSIKNMVIDIKNKHSIDIPDEILVQKYFDIIDKNMKDVKANDGICDFVTGFKQKNTCVVITSASKEQYIDGFLTKYGLKNCIDEVITLEKYHLKSKPSPEIYEYVQKKYGTKELIVVEDSDNGLTASFNSGAIAVLYNPQNRKTIVPYHYSIQNFSELNDIIFHDIKKGFFISGDTIELKIEDDKPFFSEEETALVDLIWEKDGKGKFDGRILAFDRLSYEDHILKIYAYLTSYKYLFACKKTKALSNRITALAVSGVLEDREGNVVISKRGNVTEYQGCFEFVPSGGMDASVQDNDFARQIGIELEEELGISVSADRRWSVETMGLCYDASQHDMDVCLRIRYEDVFSYDMFTTNDEYDSESLRIMNKKLLDMDESKSVYTSMMIAKHI